MTTYTVVWKIDIEADTPEEAARKALAIHRDPESIATVFDVTPGWPSESAAHFAIRQRVDITEIDEERADDERALNTVICLRAGA